MSAEPRTFLVTGASGGVGPYAARRLLARGDHVVLMARDGDRLRALAGELGDDSKIAVFAGAAQNPADADAAVALGCERFDKVDGLVALAGAFVVGLPVALADPDAYTGLFEANVLTAAMASRAVLRRLQGPGSFVYLNSMLVHDPMPSMGPYVASKAALNAWAAAFSREVKDRGHRVNVIETRLIDTPKHREQQPGADHSQWVPAENIADTIAFLTSEEPGAASMFGGVIQVKGTFTPGPPAGGPPGQSPPGGAKPPEPPPLSEGGKTGSSPRDVPPIAAQS